MDSISSIATVITRLAGCRARKLSEFPGLVQLKLHQYVSFTVLLRSKLRAVVFVLYVHRRHLLTYRQRLGAI